MRCFASPTTSTAAEPRDDTARRGEQLAAAILFRTILKPLAQGLGPLGDVVVGTVADDVFVRRAR